jgi:transcriptional regulator with XRE-family HTH domain
MATARARFTDPDVDRTIAAAIKVRLVALDMTQQELADKVGMPINNLSGRLLGHRQFRAAELKAIADVLGVEVGKLFEDPRGPLGVAAVRKSDGDLLTCTFNALAQVSGYGLPVDDGNLNPRSTLPFAVNPQAA